MEITNLLEFTDREQLRKWLERNHTRESQCWIVCNRGKQPKPQTIGDNVTIGAGSVVTKDIPSDVVAAGNPCRVRREI